MCERNGDYVCMFRRMWCLWFVSCLYVYAFVCILNRKGHAIQCSANNCINFYVIMYMHVNAFQDVTVPLSQTASPV